MTDELIPWLHHVLNAVEQTARDAGGAVWATGRESGYTYGRHGNQPDGAIVVDSDGTWPQPYTAEDTHVYAAGGGMVVVGSPVTTPAQHRHIAFHNPAHALAQVDSTRRILDLHALIWRNIGWLETDADGTHDEAYEELEVCGHCVPKHSHFGSRAEVPTGPCQTIRLLGMACAHLPGYREEWRP